VERALTFEIVRQRDLLKKGVKIQTETRHWDDVRRTTLSLRVKEEEQDYRYFLEPDLTPVRISQEMVELLRSRMPELPDARKERFLKAYGLPEYDAEVLTSDRAMADFFEECAKLYDKPKAVANWLMGDVLQCLHSLEVDIDQAKLAPQYLAEMLKLMDRGDISIKIAKKVLWEVMKHGKSPSTVVREKDWWRITDLQTLEGYIAQVFKEYPKAVEDALVDEKTIHYLIGKTMEATGGKADPELTNALIRKKLSQMKKGS
jgi:aspartyl-tRNA(Asn)/glutamyl-tRNA(Gln) amidotransferase subunit B